MAEERTASGTRQSQRIRCPSYRPRTTWRLPEIVTVRCSVSYSSLLLIMCCSIVKTVAPTSFHASHRHSSQETTAWTPATSSTEDAHSFHEPRVTPVVLPVRNIPVQRHDSGGDDRVAQMSKFTLFVHC
jgi:hypothetical protein